MTSSEAAVLRVPVPGLVVLIGPAGAGKSTLARHLFAPDEVLSSDALRAAIAGDEGDQSVSRTAFAILHRELGRRLAAGRLVVVDATNLLAEHRRPLLARASAAGVEAVAIILDLPAAIVTARNGGRARVVGPEVVALHLDRAEGLGRRGPEALHAEGFRTVVTLRTPEEVDRLGIARIPAAPLSPRA